MSIRNYYQIVIDCVYGKMSRTIFQILSLILIFVTIGDGQRTDLLEVFGSPTSKCIDHWEKCGGYIFSLHINGERVYRPKCCYSEGVNRKRICRYPLRWKNEWNGEYHLLYCLPILPSYTHWRTEGDDSVAYKEGGSESRNTDGGLSPKILCKNSTSSNFASPDN